jgi:prepilin-type N-terminal cleavage/methylation domain-containing protein
MIPIGVNAEWYARRVGVAAAREINKIPAGRPSTDGSTLRPAGMKGFTLLEVIIALIIAGMAAVALFEAVGSGLHATTTASMYDQAIVRAKSRLAAATYATRLTPGDQRGDDGGGFQWRTRVAPVASASVRAVGLAGPQGGKAFPVVLYSITVWIGWNDGGTERQVRLETEQVGG